MVPHWSDNIQFWQNTSNAHHLRISADLLIANMPLNDERLNSTSSGEDLGSDVESTSERYDSLTSSSDLDCSRESFTSDCSSKHCTPSCEYNCCSFSQTSRPKKLYYSFCSGGHVCCPSFTSRNLLNKAWYIFTKLVYHLSMIQG